MSSPELQAGFRALAESLSSPELQAEVRAFLESLGVYALLVQTSEQEYPDERDEPRRSYGFACFEEDGRFRCVHDRMTLFEKLVLMLGMAKYSQPLKTPVKPVFEDPANWRTADAVWLDDFEITGLRFIATHGELKAIPLTVAHGKPMSELFVRRLLPRTRPEP